MEAVLPRAWRRDSPWHGETHWRCVAGDRRSPRPRRDADRAGSSFCFGLLHDTRRENEAIDPGHGARAAAFAGELRDEGALELDDAEIRPPGRGAPAPLRRAGLGRRDDRRLLGRRPAPPPPRLHRARSRALLDPRLPTATRRSRRPRRSATRGRRTGARSWASRWARPRRAVSGCDDPQSAGADASSTSARSRLGRTPPRCTLEALTTHRVGTDTCHLSRAALPPGRRGPRVTRCRSRMRWPLRRRARPTAELDRTPGRSGRRRARR